MATPVPWTKATIPEACRSSGFTRSTDPRWSGAATPLSQAGGRGTVLISSSRYASQTSYLCHEAGPTSGRSKSAFSN